MCTPKISIYEAEIILRLRARQSSENHNTVNFKWTCRLILQFTDKKIDMQGYKNDCSPRIELLNNSVSLSA